MILIGFLALIALVASTQDAHAAFIVAPLVGLLFTAGTTAFAIASAVAVTALTVGVSYVANKLLGPSGPQPLSQQQTELGVTKAQTVGGVQLDIRVDADIPQSLIVGRAMTAGSLVYAETYGKRGEIDNSDLIEITALADHPCEGLVKVFVEGQSRSLNGEIVGGYNSKLKVKFYDGSQTAADALTLSKFATHSKRPWLSNMVGTGISYVRTRSIYDPDKVPGRLRWRYVVDGIKLYDPRKDSTVGGSGSHRFDTLSTHEFSRNLAVIAYNILRGIRVLDSGGTPRHFYGIEGTTAAALPLAEWFAAMNECDVTVGGEPQFWGGAEIPVVTEPIETIREILKACGGRLTENGGVFKLYIGAPGLPVVSIDDGALRADEGDSFKPILPLEQRINHISGSYTRPSDGWIPRVAPARSDSDAEAADGRRITADIAAPWVQSGKHMQRLQKQLLARARQERRHTIPMPPAVWGLEPGDAVEWTSERNGYNAKLFEVESGEDFHNLNSVISIVEIDADDYDWDEGADLIPESDGTLSVDRPAPKEVGSFSAAGIIDQGTNNTVRPAIRVSWDDPEDADVTTIRVAYRIASEPTNIAYAFSSEPTSEALVIVNLQPLTNYEVKAQFESKNGWATEKTLWLPVVTPDARFSLHDLDLALDARLKQLDRASDAAISRRVDELFDRQDSLAHTIMGIAGELDAQDQSYQNAVGSRVLRVTEEVATEALARASAISEVSAVLANPGTGELAAAGALFGLIGEVATVGSDLGSLATLFGNVFAGNSEGEANAMMRFTAHAAPTGVAARVALEAKTVAGSYGADSAALFLDAVAGAGSRATIIADRFMVQTKNGAEPVFAVSGDRVSIAGNVHIDGDLIADGTVGGTKLAAKAITADKIRVGTITADRFIRAGISNPKTESSRGHVRDNGGWGSIVSISPIVIDNGVLAILVTGQMYGRTKYRGILALRVTFNGKFVSGTANYITIQSPGWAGISVAFIIPKRDLKNGRYRVRLEASFSAKRRGFKVIGRLGVMTPRA